MGWACVHDMEDKKCIPNDGEVPSWKTFTFENLEGDGRIILKWILGRYCEDEKQMELAQYSVQWRALYYLWITYGLY